MSKRTPLIARALELARTGEIADVDQLIRRLLSEGFDDAEIYMAGHREQRQVLNKRCRDAWRQAGNPAHPRCYRSIGRLRPTRRARLNKATEQV